ncbi:WD repeat-containing and planar cell polarity effector protein fritz [Prorops nasuta]|uniref:WD repeat-containing and planar cell polarity effector protein fritz n=1 Tax=Prorops nasuta TaxID=863751 RepID=UPI0034CF8F8E
MFTFIHEVNLWTFDDNINLKDTDFGAVRYNDKRANTLYEEGKRSYCQKRGMIYVPTNKKGNKLKDSIKYLEEQLQENSTIHCQWYDDSTMRIMLSNGLLIQVQINIATGDIQKITFDKYLIGKISDHVSDAVITKNHLICTYNDNQITLVNFTKTRRNIFDKIYKLEPKLSVLNICGPSGRRLDKKIEVNRCGDLVLIWWKSILNEVYPWSPTVREQDRANIHLYRLTGIKLELICYVRTEFDPLCIMFDACHDNVIYSIEQKVSRKGEVTIEWRTYEVSQQDKLQRITVISVPLPTHASCVKFSPSQEVLLLCCIDGSVILYDQAKDTTTSTKAIFIPTLASWHSDSIIFTVGNDRGQFQHFDISLSPIKCQALSEEAAPTNILDLSSYFRNQPALLKMGWSQKTDQSIYLDYYSNSDSLFLLLFERGPIGMIKVVEGNHFTGDVLVQKYLALSHVEQATALLLSLNWNTYPSICMHSLNQILNYLFKLPLTDDNERLIQNSLGSFHVPSRPISQTVDEEFGDEIRDLTRRFFYHLLRYGMFEKAFRLAIDLNDHDLFMDIHFYALVVNDTEMATAAREKAEQIISRSTSCSSSHSTCSRDSCSICSGSISDKGDESYSEESECYSKQQNMLKLPHRRSEGNLLSQIPPLPVLSSSHYDTNLISTAFNDIPSIDRIDYNLISTSFNTSNNAAVTSTLNQSSHTSISNTFFASTPFNEPYSKANSSGTFSTPTIHSHSSSPYKNFSDDLVIPSIENLSLNLRKSIYRSKPSDNSVGVPTNNDRLNDAQSHQNCTAFSGLSVTALEDSSVPTSSFHNQSYDSLPDNNYVKVATSLEDRFDNNIMSTSFSTLTANPSTTLYSSNRLHTPAPTYSRDITKLSSNINNTNCSLMTTPFNSSETELNSNPNDGNSHIFGIDEKNESAANCKSQKYADFDVPPPPPSITSSLTNYLQNLPKKNLSLSRSASGLLDIESTAMKFSSLKTPSVASRISVRQNSVSNILKNQHGILNQVPSRSYKLSYDLDYLPFHSSCDNIGSQQNSPNLTKARSFNALNCIAQANYTTQSKLLDNKHSRLGSHSSMNINKDTKIVSNVPPLPVVNPSFFHVKTTASLPIYNSTPTISIEKPKVKFSDTVTHILVPGTSQLSKQKRSTTVQPHMTDPKRELAESLPLCLGNEDYLKNFQPLSKDADTEKAKELKSDESAKIKVVHFGLL